MYDFIVHDHGSIALLQPITDEALLWADENLPEDASMWATTFVVEPRYLPLILEGIVADGLTLTWGVT
jgi:hypothetical protein